MTAAGRADTDSRRNERVYAALSRVYDDWFDWALGPGRREALGELPVAAGDRLLEVGVGTGLSFPPHVFTVDLATQTVTTPDGETFRFDVDPGRKSNLMAGLDEIGASLTAAPEIDRFEQQRRAATPWLEPAS